MEPNKRVAELLEKYWRAETSEAEEEELKEYFASNPALHDHPAAALFSYFKKEQHIDIPEHIDKRFKPPVGKKTASVKWLSPLVAIAAAIVILFSIGYFLIPESKPARLVFKEADTYTDPKQAFLETKKAMLLISRNLNAGEDYVSEIGRLNKAEQIIQTKADKP